jgi:hypothetical protein
VWLFGHKVILKVISFRTTIPIKIVLVRFKNCFCSLNNHQNLFLFYLFYFQNYFV